MICLDTFLVSGKKPVLHQGTRWNQLCEQHLASLDDAYYERGAARLKRLAEWSRGRIPEK
ncbi:MAG: hypothetical protein ACYS32_08820 [Planctomycetota bacterium]